MKFQTAKDPKELKLKGIQIDVVMTKENPKSIRFTDVDGSVVIVQQGEYSNFELLVPAAPEMVKRHRLSGKIAGISFSQQFENEYEAKDKVSELVRETRQDGDNFTIEEIEVEA